MTRHPYWTDTAIELIAHRFKLLSEPSRLRLLLALRDGELTVSELVTCTGIPQSNVSQHLNLLAAGGLILRRKEHQKVWYRLADNSLVALQTLVCQSLQRQASTELDTLANEWHTTAAAIIGGRHVPAAE